MFSQAIFVQISRSWVCSQPYLWLWWSVWSWCKHFLCYDFLPVIRNKKQLFLIYKFLPTIFLMSIYYWESTSLPPYYILIEWVE